MRAIAYILLLIAAALAIVGLIVLLDDKSKKRKSVLNSLEKARQVKAEKKELQDSDDILQDIEDEITQIENLKN